MLWANHFRIIGFSKPKNWKYEIQRLMWKIIWFLFTLCCFVFLYQWPSSISILTSTLTQRSLLISIVGFFCLQLSFTFFLHHYHWHLVTTHHYNSATVGPLQLFAAIKHIEAHNILSPIFKALIVRCHSGISRNPYQKKATFISFILVSIGTDTTPTSPSKNPKPKVSALS